MAEFKRACEKGQKVVKIVMYELGIRVSRNEEG